MSGDVQTADYCRRIESYLCQKNDGHLIRITGPSFDRVSGWAERGIPVGVACRGIDRYFERYYAKGPRRRPVRIDFCEADVLDVFDEWRRATGVTMQSAGSRPQERDPDEPARRGPSLPAHVERVLRRLTAARASGGLDARFDPLLDRVAAVFDAVRGARGSTRQALVDRLAALDGELVEQVRAGVAPAELDALRREADEELAAFRTGMSVEAFERAREAALIRLVRERHHLPVIAFDA